jgi:hypothetical protein
MVAGINKKEYTDPNEDTVWNETKMKLNDRTEQIKNIFNFWKHKKGLYDIEGIAGDIEQVIEDEVQKEREEVLEGFIRFLFKYEPYCLTHPDAGDEWYPVSYNFFKGKMCEYLSEGENK